MPPLPQSSIMKTTSIQTTKRAMCRIMSKRCLGNHQSRSRPRFASRSRPGLAGWVKALGFGFARLWRATTLTASWSSSSALQQRGRCWTYAWTSSARYSNPWWWWQWSWSAHHHSWQHRHPIFNAWDTSTTSWTFLCWIPTATWTKWNFLDAISIVATGA